MKGIGTVYLLGLMLATSSALAESPMIVRLIVMLQPTSRDEVVPVQPRLQALSARTGVSLHLDRNLTQQMLIVSTLSPETETELQTTLAHLRADPDVKSVVVDQRTQTF